ncbi:hypothetical protein Catovirus_2_192 [Catovirus CTV1]|uniref:Uncharacterized protein n=1 Tax=Catovirus CTV1 TaxID=1977631 RepID=A0A1V0SC01_9VIRU|nr:hypothetical protein Catovirus_2_192 [Catovirus CTV1]
MDYNTLEREMYSYANRYKLENSNNDNNNNVKDKQRLASEIHDNIHKMNYSEKLNCYKKIITESKINRELLSYELENYVPEKKINNFTELVKTIQKYLKRYHKMAGGYLIEDNEWNLHVEGTKKYKLKKNEAIFDNSLKDNNVNCEETHNFMKNLVNMFSTMTDNFKVRFKYLPDNQERIYWIIIKISGKN